MDLSKLFPNAPEEARGAFGEQFLGQHPFIAIAEKIEWQIESRFLDYTARPFCSTYYNGRYPITEQHVRLFSRYRGWKVDEWTLYDEFREWFWGSWDDNIGARWGIYVKSYGLKRCYLDTDVTEEEVDDAVEWLKCGQPMFTLARPKEPLVPNPIDDDGSDAWKAWQRYYEDLEAYEDAYSDFEEDLADYDRAVELADRYLDDFRNWLEFCQDMKTMLAPDAIDKTILGWVDEQIEYWRHEWLADRWNEYQSLNYVPVKFARKERRVAEYQAA